MAFKTPKVLAPTGTRIRAFLGDRAVADSREAVVFRESPFKLLYGFPKEHLDVDTLGEKALVKEDEELREELSGFRFIEFGDVDRWMEEEEELIGHPRDPYTRIDVRRSSVEVRIEKDGVLVAETTRPRILLETGLPIRYYIPKEDVNWDVLEKTDHETVCPYKGRASYWSIRAGGETYENMVWDYPKPFHDSEPVGDCVGLYQEKLDVTVDGEPEEKPPRFFTK